MTNADTFDAVYEDSMMDEGTCPECGDHGEIGVMGICENCYADEEADQHQEEMRRLLESVYPD